MTEKELINLIKEQSIELPQSGVDRWPGYMMNLDTEEIAIDGKVVNLKLIAWYDLEDDKRQPESVNCFIITYRYIYIIVDFFHEAKAIWEHLIKINPIPD